MKQLIRYKALSRCVFCLFLCTILSYKSSAQVADQATYLSDLKKQMKDFTTKSKNINFVFHGHSVPAGYWAQSTVHTQQSYPNLLLKKLNVNYPHAVMNVIVSAKGSETAERGQLRLATDALIHNPDVLFIDYALNDIGTSLERARTAWEKMIEEALKKGTKVILVTPSPDQRRNINDANDLLAQHADQIRKIAEKYHIGLVDPYAAFKEISRKDGSVEAYMSHVNHPNEKGHDIIASLIYAWLN